jgi:hypothetical protein
VVEKAVIIKSYVLGAYIVETPNTKRLAGRLYIKRFIIKRETAHTNV